jgi:hypothetical protein
MRNFWLVEGTTSRLKVKRAVEFQFVEKGVKRRALGRT